MVTTAVNHLDHCDAVRKILGANRHPPYELLAMKFGRPLDSQCKCDGLARCGSFVIQKELLVASRDCMKLAVNTELGFSL